MPRDLSSELRLGIYMTWSYTKFLLKPICTLYTTSLSLYKIQPLNNSSLMLHCQSVRVCTLSISEFLFCFVSVRISCNPGWPLNRSITKDDPEFLISLPSSSECMHYSIYHHAQFYAVLGIESRAFSVLGNYFVNGDTSPASIPAL